METWYRARFDCELSNIEWSDVRSHTFAECIHRHVLAGIPRGTFLPVIFDPRFFPWQFDPPQSRVSAKNTRSLLLWAANRWPEWSLSEFSIYPIIGWLEVLNEQDQQKTLEILEDTYGLRLDRTIGE